MDWIEVKKEVIQTNNFIFVECIAEIRNNMTNEIREFQTVEILKIDDECPSVFNWQENNYSCDCNRFLFYKKANNEETENDLNAECSNGKFSVNLKNKKDGKVYYREYGA